MAAFSRPALTGTAVVKQPDGTTLTIRLVGDEYRSFTTTADGYTLTRNGEGYYVYAALGSDGRLAPTELVAHDAAVRTAREVAYTESVGKRLTPAIGERQSEVKRRNQAARAQVLAGRRAAGYDYGKFRGLVILVEYNDCSFRYSDYADIMEKMINQDGYTGESRTNISTTVRCTGSMRDYFRDNSSGAFVPTFDVVGPVKVNRSQYYPRPDGDSYNNNYGQLMLDAVNAADGLVNFKDYDVDGNGVVDMIYFIFAGLPSYIVGNDQRLLWPHQSDLSYFTYTRKDGVYLGRYACSTELYGQEDYSVLEGIGTMTHEFSHILGLPDFYDTNNANDEDCVNPGLWSVMAGGADGNYGRTPVNYSLFERYALGFATPEVIGEAGTYSMAAIHKSNTGFRLNTPVRKEFFLLENRQREKWDAVLPGHGMLIFRVDSTNSRAWTDNSVNDAPRHPYYELVRAKSESSPSTTDSGRDPFPGTGRVTTINNETSPASLLTWAGLENEFGLRGITEKSGIISFEAYYVNVLTGLSLPDSVVMGSGTTLQLSPVLVPENARASLTWTSDNNDVAVVGGEGLVRAVGEGRANVIVRSDNDLSDTCVVIVRELETVGSISAFLALGEGTSAQLRLDGAKVLFTHGDDVYVRDSSGSIVVSGTGLEAQRDDDLSGVVFGRLEFVDRVPHLTAVEGNTSVSGISVTSGGEAAVPRPVKPGGRLTDDLLADLVVAQGVTLVVSDRKLYAEVGSQRAQVFNTFGLSSKEISTPSTKNLSGKYFDVTGILTTTAVTADSLGYVLSLTNSVVEVEKPEDSGGTDPELRGDVNGDGSVDVADISTIITVMAESGSGSFAAAADVNGDGSVDVADISSVVSIMADASARESLALMAGGRLRK